MKKIILIFFCFPAFLFSQVKDTLIHTNVITDSIQYKYTISGEDTLSAMKMVYFQDENRYLLGFLPSKANNIYGLAIGLVGSESYCNVGNNKYTHGLNIQLGKGLFVPFQIQFIKDDIQENFIQSAYLVSDSSGSSIHNGIIISVFGNTTTQTNGIAISGFSTIGNRLNGIAINPIINAYNKVNGLVLGLFNYSQKVNGFQIGLINKTVKLKGLQIGLWNRSEKRSFPIINWN
jgi:hypothetical protein